MNIDDIKIGDIIDHIVGVSGFYFAKSEVIEKVDKRHLLVKELDSYFGTNHWPLKPNPYNIDINNVRIAKDKL